MKLSNVVKNILIAVATLIVVVYIYPSPETVHFKFEENKPWNYAQLIAPCKLPILEDSMEVNHRLDSVKTNFLKVFTIDPKVTDVSIKRAYAQSYKKLTEGRTEISADERRIYNQVLNFILTEIYTEDAGGRPVRFVVDNSFADDIKERDNGKAIRVVNGNTLVEKNAYEVTTPEEAFQRICDNFNSRDVTIWAKRYQIADLLVPNLVYDSVRSEEMLIGELGKARGEEAYFQPGQTIIEKGKIISHQDYINICTYEEYVNQMGMGQSDGILLFLGHLLYAAALLAALTLYLRFSYTEIWGRSRSVLFIFVAVALFFVVGVGCESFLDSGMYIVPYAVVPILLVVFFNAQVAMFVSLVLTLLCAPCVTFPLEFIMLQFCGAVAAVYSLRELARRSQLLRTALFVLVTYIVLYLAIEMLMNGSLSAVSVRMPAYLAVSAMLCSIAYILMDVVERVFGFVSVVTMVELCDVNHPLLRKLSELCPGTFQHSIAVGTLATDAAIKIGANEQLVRAGALYHDIGKMSNPNFFTENQRGVNPHDALSPDQSAQIIIQHVTDGVARADRAGLPSVIKDFIRQHHGAGKAKYFYFTYCKAHPGEDVDPAPFTYPGPNPRTREASLLMMADSVEAASRSLREHTPEAISSLVDKIIDGQIADGLHNDSSLSFRDVRIIKNEFVKRLMTMYHSRISYPEDPNKKAK